MSHGTFKQLGFFLSHSNFSKPGGPFKLTVDIFYHQMGLTNSSLVILLVRCYHAKTVTSVDLINHMHMMVMFLQRSYHIVTMVSNKTDWT